MEDIFPLTEMKNGLMTPANVEELVGFMRKESDSVVMNLAEATRHLSAVASTIEATENRELLDLFVKLDGLRFLIHWLQKAQKSGDLTSDCTTEELIIALLGAFKKLPIDQDCLVSSKIMETIKDLLGHKSSRVQGRARALYDDWNNGRDTSYNPNNDKNQAPCENGVFASAEVVLKSENLEESAVAEDIKTLSANGDGQMSTDENHGLLEAQENLPIGEKCCILSAEGTVSIEGRLGSQVQVEGHLGYLQEPDLQNHIGSTDDSTGVLPSKAESEMIDLEVSYQHESIVTLKTTSEGGECSFKLLQELSSDGEILRTPNPEDIVTTDLSKPREIEVDCKPDDDFGNGALDFDLNEKVDPEGSEISKQRQDLIEIDLNLTDGVADATVIDQIPASSCILSGESSVEVSSGRAERKLGFDLNCFGDDDDDSSGDVDANFFYLNPVGYANSSPATSSSSVQHLPINIDLNENFPMADTDHTIHFMSTRVEANREEYSPVNGKSGISFVNAHEPYKNCTPYTGSSMAFPSPYTPQPFTIGLNSGFTDLPSPYTPQPFSIGLNSDFTGLPMAWPSPYNPEPFTIGLDSGLNSAPFDLNGDVSIRTGFDLNLDGAGDVGGWRSRENTELDIWSSSKCSSSSGLAMKRKEHEVGWEPYAFTHKQLKLEL